MLTAGSVPVAVAATPPAQPAPGRPREVSILELTSVRRLFDALAAPRVSADEGERAAAWADLSVLVEAVAGTALVDARAYDALSGASPGTGGPRLTATPAVATRDTVAYQLLALGYSARETADVVSGRISKRALDTAQQMVMVGQGRDAAARYLDSQYKRALSRTSPSRVPPGAGLGPFDAAIDKYASLHGVDAAIVRAIIAIESAFEPAARSRVGAIGLMQLMPATARALGVDPAIPEQNIEGGVRYFSELLKMFGGLELALVAYNAGPGFARRYGRGEAVLYGETRDYVNRVLARIRPPR